LHEAAATWRKCGQVNVLTGIDDLFTTFVLAQLLPELVNIGEA
jgi:hypothetical protein